MFEEFSKLNSRSRRKIAAGFTGEGTNRDYHYASTHVCGTIHDKALIVDLQEKADAARAKQVRHQAERLGLRYGKHIGSKPVGRVLQTIRRYNKQMESLYV